MIAIRELAALRLEALIGRGTLGSVWRARDGAGQVVAVKRVAVLGDEELVAALAEDGGQLLGFERADSVVGWRVVVDGPVVGLVMDLAVGGSWTERLRRGRAEGNTGAGRPASEVARVGAQVAATLALLHRAGILHGDLKGSAVLFDGPREARLGDVGVAARFAERRRFGPLAGGTLGRLDPAVVAGRPFGPPSDVFALGLLCAEMLLGELPVSPRVPLRPRQATRALERGLLRLVGAVPPCLAGAIRAATDPRPEARPTMAELAGALSSAAGEPAPHGPSPRAGRPRARHARGRARRPVRAQVRPPTSETAPGQPTGQPAGRSGLGAQSAGKPAGVLGLQGRSARQPVGVLGPRAKRVARTHWGWGLGSRAARRSLQRRALVAASALAAAALGAGALWGAGRPGSGGEQQGCSRGGSPAASGRSRGRAGSLDPRCPARVARVDGDIEIRSDGSTVVLRLRPAIPEAQVVLGDFGCNGRDTPAVYDDRTGLVAVYLAWPGPGRPVRPASIWQAARGGRLMVERKPGTRCSTLRVAPARQLTKGREPGRGAPARR